MAEVWHTVGAPHAAPAVQVEQLPPLQMSAASGPHEVPSGLFWIVQLAGLVEQSVAEVWHTIRAPHAAPAVQVEQLPPLQMSAACGPHEVPSGMFGIVQVAGLVLQSVAEVWHPVGAPHTAPAVQVEQLPPLQMSAACGPHEVPSGMFRIAQVAGLVLQSVAEVWHTVGAPHAAPGVQVEQLPPLQMSAACGPQAVPSGWFPVWTQEGMAVAQEMVPVVQEVGSQAVPDAQVTKFQVAVTVPRLPQSMRYCPWTCEAVTTGTIRSSRAQPG